MTLNVGVNVGVGNPPASNAPTTTPAVAEAASGADAVAVVAQLAPVAQLKKDMAACTTCGCTLDITETPIEPSPIDALLGEAFYNAVLAVHCRDCRTTWRRTVHR